MHASLIGYGRFGKIDGFQWLDREGLLTDFQSPTSLTTLSRLLALRQESIRPFVGEDILGLTEMVHAGQKIRFVSLYRYALDQDKRDGYLAATIGFRQASAAPADITLALEALLQGQDWRSDFLPSLQQWTEPSWAAEQDEGAHTAFVFLNDSHPVADLVGDYWRNTYLLYRWVYASKGIQTLLSLEKGAADVDILNTGYPSNRRGKPKKPMGLLI
jgi:hypothetical protein